MIDLADLSPQPPRLVSRGPADYAFNLIFSLPFDDQAVADYQHRPAPADVDVAASDAAPLPFWRKARTPRRSAWPSRRASRRSASRPARSCSAAGARAVDLAERDTAALNDRMASRRRIAEISAGVAGAAALTGAWLVFGPRSSVHPAGAFDSNSGTVGLAGGF